MSPYFLTKCSHCSPGLKPRPPLSRRFRSSKKLYTLKKTILSSVASAASRNFLAEAESAPPLAVTEMIKSLDKGCQNLMKNKSSYNRVKLKRIKFELYTEPDLNQTWTRPDLDLN